MIQPADAEDIEITLIKSRLRWLGHVSRMDDNRPVKALIYGELEKGTRAIGCMRPSHPDIIGLPTKAGL